MKHPVRARLGVALPDNVVDFCLERARRHGTPPVDFKVGDQVVDRQTGAEGFVIAITRTGADGRASVCRVQQRGLARILSTDRLVMFDPSVPPPVVA